MTILSADASKNGSTHILISLCTVAEAEFVWIVERTK
jgi:hypothetical protein